MDAIKSDVFNKIDVKIIYHLKFSLAALFFVFLLMIPFFLIEGELIKYLRSAHYSFGSFMFYIFSVFIIFAVLFYCFTKFILKKYFTDNVTFSFFKDCFKINYSSGKCNVIYLTELKGYNIRDVGGSLLTRNGFALKSVFKDRPSKTITIIDSKYKTWDGVFIKEGFFYTFCEFLNEYNKSCECIEDCIFPVRQKIYNIVVVTLLILAIFFIFADIYLRFFYFKKFNSKGLTIGIILPFVLLLNSFITYNKGKKILESLMSFQKSLILP